MSQYIIRKFERKDKEKLSDFVMTNFVPYEAVMSEHINSDSTVFNQAKNYIEDQFVVSLKLKCCIL